MTKERRRRTSTALPPDEDRVVFGRVEQIVGPVPMYIKTSAGRLAFERLFKHFDTDQLTGLPGADPIIERLKNTLDERERDEKNISKIKLEPHVPADRRKLEHEPCTIAFCDINKFKAINDKLGEERTDLVIRSLARFLQKKMRRSIDMIARYNHRRGDEFIIIMEPANVKDVENHIEKHVLGPLDNVIFQFPDSKMGVKIQMAFGAYELDSSVQDGQHDTPSKAIEKADLIMRGNKQKMQDNGQVSRIFGPEDIAAEKAKGAQVVEVDMSEISTRPQWTGSVTSAIRRRTLSQT